MANSKYAYPISVSSCHAAGQTQNINVSCYPGVWRIQNLHTLSMFLLTMPRGKRKISVVHLAPLTLFPINKHLLPHQLSPHRGSNQKRHTLSMFLSIPPNGEFKMCTPYQCFFLPRRGANAKYQCFLLSWRLANSKFAHPISVSSWTTAGQTQNISGSSCTPNVILYK